jgi:molecular chaperone DnaJ
MDPYQVLGLPRGASEEEVKRQYRMLAKQHHPDKATGNEDTFKNIKEAYDRIISGNAEPPCHNEMPPHVDAMFNHIFRTMGAQFTTNMPGNIFTFQQRAVPRRTLQHQRIDIPLSEVDIFYGCTRRLDFECKDRCPGCEGCKVIETKDVHSCSVCMGHGFVDVTPFVHIACKACASRGITTSRACGTCNGSGFVFRKRGYDIKCPKGVPDGHETTMQGKGPYDEALDVYADLILVFRHSAVSQRIRVESGKDVHIDVHTELRELFLGFKRILHVYNEQYNLSTSGYVDPGKPLILVGQGLPCFTDPSPGDLYVHLKVSFPESLAPYRVQWSDSDDDKAEATTSSFSWSASKPDPENS